jgi:hypothetical protein
MNTICCTRFNENTWNQNKRWRETHEYVGCIYNSPVKIREIVPLLTIIYVIEMNNDLNKIMGIGLIKNYVHTQKYVKIYDAGNYNRYTYKSKYRIDCLEFTTDEKCIIDILETLLFKGKGHSKRGHGIQRIPEWILENKSYDFINFFKNLFKEHFVNKTLI